MSNLTVADVLEKAADLIEPDGAWTRMANARNRRGYPTPARSVDAACFCMAGAILRAGDGDYSAAGLVRTVLPKPQNPAHDWLVKWNDAPERTQSEVVAKLREAASLARSANA